MAERAGRTIPQCGVCDGIQKVEPFDSSDGDVGIEWLCIYCWAQIMSGDDDGVLDRQVRNGAVDPPRGWPFRDAAGRLRVPREPFP